MEQKKLFFYECILQCDVVFEAARHREPPEKRFGFADENLMEHVVRFYPYGGLGGGRPFADVLCVEKPIAWYFLEAREKMVSRPGETQDGQPDARHRIMRPKLTKVKFRLLALEEITEEVKLRAKAVRLRDIDYQDWHDAQEAEAKKKGVPVTA